MRQQQVTDVMTVWSFLPSITTVQTHSNMKTICYGNICIRTFFLKKLLVDDFHDHINKWFHVALNLLSERSQMMFTCKNKKVAQGMIFWARVVLKQSEGKTSLESHDFCMLRLL